MANTQTPHFNLSPTDGIFMNENAPSSKMYHNIGQLRTPYIGKTANFKSAQGDYGPPQRTVYYTPSNPVYPYPMMEDWASEQYLPGWGCVNGSPYKYPSYDYSVPNSAFVPPNYFSPKTKLPQGKFIPTSQTYGKKLIQNIVQPVREDIMPVEYRREKPTENFKYMDVLHDNIQYNDDHSYRKYISLKDSYTPLTKYMPPYKDGEKWKI
jgi:hypothetical protein